jgi:predicted methyltransferase
LADPVVEEVARVVRLVEGARGVEAVLTALARLEPVSVRALGRAADLPVPIVAAICNELRRRGHVSETRPVQFTVQGRRRFATGGESLETACPACGGRSVTLAPTVARLRRGLAAVAEAAPPPLVELDQCHCTPKTKLRRVVAMHAAAAITNRRILLLGDDDLMAVALLRFARQLDVRIAEVAVLDIDERLVRFIAAELEDAPFPVRCEHWDAREPLPPSFARRFDTIVSDPPYTVAGARLFLSRAVEASAAVSQIFLSYGSRRPGAHFEVQRVIAELGLEIRALTRDFNDYVGAGVLGGTSHLYQLASSTQTAQDDGLYTAARRRTAARPSTSRPRATRSAEAR